MGHSSVRGEGTQEGAPDSPAVRDARELGWDDSLDAVGTAGDGGPAGTEEGAATGVPAQRSGSRAEARAAARAAGAGGGRRRGSTRRRARSGKRKVFRWVASVLSLLILATALAGYLYIEHLNGNIRSGGRSGGDSGVRKAEPNAAGNTPLNILLIGADGRNSKENLALGGAKDTVGDKPRGDVQMLLHVSADRKSAAVVSIPRDTRVDIPKCQDPKTNETFPATNRIITESLQRGGPGCTLTTWETLTGVYIDYWMMVDFAGVVKMADAVGGVKVCVKQNVWDRPTAQVKGGSGLKLTKGDHYIKGEDALKWLRTRHAFYNDQGRAKAQHMYMNSMLRQLKQQNAFTDTGRIMDLAEAGTKALQVSEEIASVQKLFDLAMELKDVPTERITMTTVMTDEDPQNSAHLVLNKSAADKVWRMLREDVAFDDKGGPPTAQAKKPAAKESGPPAAAPGTLALTVLNGTGGGGEFAVKGRAKGIAEVLVGKGFTRTNSSQAAAQATETVLAYPKSAGAQGKADALSVAKAVGLPAGAVRPSAEVTELTLTVGADWREGDTFPKQQAPKAGELPEGSEVSNGADDKDCMDVYKPYRWS
ncbi:LCP family protein [Streptomyces coeruleoprunus]|uniref:LCP family protein n=1 Tax=Streptomyces coeruleoprunus TaxID=285563 RepID=A0ABV9XKE3_9ACTN